ncbi:3-oxo-5a-steroid 4- dehydrogenase [Coemansia guatemalensis]|uniref:3-oxo-5a-steroid 4- dehydrogenase n=1 Tax=Coemansia guatemalensis TaxID=2761395 RepID=A0A9W8HRW0_9FUNG|nr:3-oxo-5a-steroid 4- dehydrogenase [Coemansia guatemalensis]
MRINVDKRSSTKPGAKTQSKQASSKYPFAVELSDAATVDDLKGAIAAQIKTLAPDRQRLTSSEKKTVLKSGDTLAKYNIKEGDTIHVKDLGPQIGWQTVFYIEYFGPIIFHYLIYNLQHIFYGQTFEHSAVQQ